MDDFFTPVSQTYLKPRPEDTIPNTPKHKIVQVQDGSPSISTLADALEHLKSQPDYDSLMSTLKFVDKDNKLSIPSPDTAQIIQLLVSDIVPNYWPLLRDGQADDRARLLSCLLNIAGINSILARIRTLIQDSRSSEKEAKRPDITLGLETLLQVLKAVLDDDRSLYTLWQNVQTRVASAMKKPLKHEFLSLFASSGKIVSLSAEAEAIVGRDRDQRRDSAWIADGLAYTKWVGRSITAWIVGDSTSDDAAICSEMFVKALRLGYGDQLIKQLIENLLLGAGDGTNHFLRLFGNLSHLEQKRVLYAVLKHLAETFLNRLERADAPEAASAVAAAASVINNLVGTDESRKNHLVVWLTSATGAGVGDSIGIRRAALAALARDREVLSTVLDKSLNLFGDELYIKHSPLLQQEVHAQVVLLSAAYVQRSSPLKIKMLTRSGGYLQTVSNRLSASQTKARILGMIIGEAISSLSEAKLDFKMEELDTEEARWLKSLVRVHDEIGSIDTLLTKVAPTTTKAPAPLKPRAAPTGQRRPVLPKQTGFVIEEVEDSEEEEDADLVSYSKPDFDPEDSDEDATMIRRDKPKPPVYVRDLITYLRDTENYDKQKLALETAPSLIRRKANFGSEVREHAEELASLLVGLQDKFEMDGFYEQRTQGMIAVLVAQPRVMAPWFAKTFFDGDYSISQRASVLIVLGLSARELAGFDVSEYAATTTFPSKRLPERMERLYIDANTPGLARIEAEEPGSNLKALPATALDSISKDLTSSFLAPLAANAADTATGPDVLKLSTFTSRLKAQGTSSGNKSRAKPRVRAIPNTTATLLATGFFAPLTARFQHALRSPASQRYGSVVFQPYLLSLYLKTLAILIHAAGPSTLSLPQMTSELWDLLLGVRGHIAGDLTATHALLVALVSMLEVNNNNGDGLRRLCADMPREVVETSEWVGALFNGMRGEDGGEESQVKTLAAGVLITLQEAMEKHRALLMGNMIGFS